MSGAARYMLVEVQTLTARVPKPPPVYRSETLGLLDILFEPNVLIGHSSFHPRGVRSNRNSPLKSHWLTVTS
jgi:hypothetical protein